MARVYQRLRGGHAIGLLAQPGVKNTCDDQRYLGLPEFVKALIIKSLYNLGLYGGEVGCMLDQHMQDSARRALGKGAGWRRVAYLALTAYIGQAADPQITADVVGE
eukprot:6326417-Amphidinium_carterae.1